MSTLAGEICYAVLKPTPLTLSFRKYIEFSVLGRFFFFILVLEYKFNVFKSQVKKMCLYFFLNPCKNLRELDLHFSVVFL